MKDNYGRSLNYLRISVTDRCNRRCRYCMPEEGIELLPHSGILTFEEITDFTIQAVAMGVTKVRLTGGEPLIKRDITTLVGMLTEIDGIEDLAMTTNGTRLVSLAQPLAAAGLMRINVSLDTLDAEKYRRITRGGDIVPVLAGIEAALEAGLTPIKLNCVLSEWIDDGDIEAVRAYADKLGIEMRIISQMDFESGRFGIVSGSTGGDCRNCNRLRLSSDGHVRPCLFSDLAYSVRELGVEEAIRRAVQDKPECGGPCGHNWMHGIGG
ncbi:MAG: radical SAM protein [bacterium]|nr:radical SAM protein [bacterium]